MQLLLEFRPCVKTDLRSTAGVSGILVWRIIAKFICHQALPPVFRFFAPIISLPRRYYLSATECESLAFLSFDT